MTAPTPVPAKFARILADVTAYVRVTPGCTRSELAATVTGNNGAIVAAVNVLLRDGAIVERGRRRLWVRDAVPDGHTRVALWPQQQGRQP